MIFFRYGLLPILLCLHMSAASAGADQNTLLEVVKEFYTWTLTNGKSVASLQPTIKNLPGGRFVLDTTNLNNFSGRLIGSGYFAPEFKQTVAHYYDRYRQQFAKLTDKEFEDMPRDGRGPLMEVEDMDIFFCAQEYEYKQSFIDGVKIKQFKTGDTTASLLVVSPYGWETPFKFIFSQGRWLISGYCVFQ
ncbi:hypothetical protein [Methylomicrobium sp. Wu6]|uniref:hypothetical protein n=1 Tax=Methylomicrobium sp. Wu6 TaxID=3107928 RepID=UPI002DD63B65|nr:hypothetical protein [Methylomicrobium sp. Wu6]MEC4750622.1 hypothetical protein [Methylomicrobium sp. Wu6]